MKEIFPRIAPGAMIVSEPQFMYLMQKRSFLICNTEEEGVSGYFLDQKANYTLKDCPINFPPVDMPVYIGGEIEMDSINFLHTVGTEIDGCKKIAEGIYEGGDVDKLIHLIRYKKINSTQVKFFRGHTSVPLCHLHSENLGIMYHVTPTAKKELVFDAQCEEIWAKALRTLGHAYFEMANFVNPILN